MTRFRRRTFLKRAVKSTGLGMAAIGASRLPAGIAAPPNTPAAETIWHAAQHTANVANLIVAENAQPGSTDWQITQPDKSIEGFASATSVAPGQALDFFVNTPAPSYDLRIYRLGYYGGLGGRLVAEVRALPGQAQPEPQRDWATGLFSCSHWAASHRLSVPNDWVSGVYIAKLVRTDTQAENEVLFVVREPDAPDTKQGIARKSDVLVQLSASTYAAYNNYGGKSLYNYNSAACQTVADAPRAVKVSLDRPASFPPFQHNSYFWPEYALTYWLEGQGYDVSYSTSFDTHRAGVPGNPNSLLGHRVFISAGHDEYWSQPMHDAIAAARDAGVNVCFFSSNVSYWRVRLEPDPWTGAPDRVIVCYKTTESGATDPSGQHTGTCRDPTGHNQPENGLLGAQYIGDNDMLYFPVRVSAEQAQDRLYRHTDLQQMQPGMAADLGQRLIGWEWDAVVDNGHTPAGLQIVATTPTYGSLLTDEGRIYKLGQAQAHMTRYTAPGGATVFAAGTNHWAWGLALFEPNPYVQQITCNVLADMGAHPATPAPTLVLDAGAPGATVQDFRDGLQAEFDPLVLSVQSMLFAEGMTLRRAGAEAAPPIRIVNLQETADPLIISDVQVTPSKNSVTVTWKTNRPATGQLWVGVMPGQFNYRLAENGGLRMPLAGSSAQATLAQNHSLSVAGLDTDTAYYARLASRDEGGRAALADELPIRSLRGTPVDVVRPLVRTFYRSLPCWLQRNAAWVASAVAGVALALLARSVWRRRIARNRAN